MASGSEDEGIFEILSRKRDPKLVEQEDRATAERARAQYAKSQQRLVDLVDDNSTLPTTISSIHIHGAPHTRRAFLGRIFDPVLSANNARPYTLSEAIREVSIAADKLHAFDIFHQPITLTLSRPSRTDPSSTPTDLSFHLTTTEKSRLLLKTGTDVGNAEGSAYLTALWRNVLGGAETLNFNASLGTRTRSAYQASFDTPLLSSPYARAELGGSSSSTSKPWASHEEVLNGGWAKYRWLNPRTSSRHEIRYQGTWRQITGLAPGASPSVRAEAGDSVKSSVSHTWTRDARDNPHMPSHGTYVKTLAELAGWGPLKGDVAFCKGEVETQGAVPVPLPYLQGVSLTAGLRGGVLVPLALGLGAEPAQRSRISDRFQLGGPTDVRGFRLAGLGPRDGGDGLGGDVYAAGSANLLFPLPRLGAEAPLRLQTFVTGGRLLALPGTGQGAGGEKKKGQVEGRGGSVLRGLKELGNGIPSIAGGVGLVYAHPAARFEVNFLVPLVVRRGEEGRKGLQFGVGINLL